MPWSIGEYGVRTGPAHGTLTLAVNGAYLYTPSPGYSSSDSFSYTLADTKGGSNVYHAFIAVRALPGASDSGSGAGPVLATIADSAEKQALLVGVVQQGMDYFPFG